MCTNCTGHTAGHGPAHAPVIAVPAAAADPAAGLAAAPSPAVLRTAASLRASPGLVVAAGNFLPGTVCFLLVSFLPSTLFSFFLIVWFFLDWKRLVSVYNILQIFCLWSILQIMTTLLIGSFVIDWTKFDIVITFKLSV